MEGHQRAIMGQMTVEGIVLFYQKILIYRILHTGHTFFNSKKRNLPRSKSIFGKSLRGGLN